MYFATLTLIFFTVFGASLADDSESCPTIVDREFWNAQPPAHDLVDLKLPVRYVIISHTASDYCSTQSECVLRIRLIQTLHIEAFGWDDIAYSFLIGGDGRVYKGRGWSKAGAHAMDWNTRSVGVAFIGTYIDVEPSETMMSAARKLIECGKSGGFLSDDVKVLGHRQVSQTLSPGDKLYSAIQKWPEWQSSP